MAQARRDETITRRAPAPSGPEDGGRHPSNPSDRLSQERGLAGELGGVRPRGANLDEALPPRQAKDPASRRAERGRVPVAREDAAARGGVRISSRVDEGCATRAVTFTSSGTRSARRRGLRTFASMTYGIRS